MAVWSSPVTNRDINNESYGVDDLSRVEENSEFLADLLTSYGYTTTISTTYPWTRSQFFNEENDNRYCSNIATLRNAVSLPETTPNTPSTLSDITRIVANNIEKIQLAIYVIIPVIVYESNLKRAGLYYAGNEVGLI